VSSTSDATRARCGSAVPNNAASAVARLKYRCAWCFHVNPTPFPSCSPSCQRAPNSRASFKVGYWARNITVCATCSNRHNTAGEIRSDVDLRLVIDAFFGTALARAVILGGPLDHDFSAALVDLLINGMAPRE
jgi:hypothetical protein